MQNSVGLVSPHRVPQQRASPTRTPLSPSDRVVPTTLTSPALRRGVRTPAIHAQSSSSSLALNESAATPPVPSSPPSEATVEAGTGPAVAAAVSVQQAAGALSAGEAALLRMELDQRRSELESRKKRIAQLEAEALDSAKIQEEQRQRAQERLEVIKTQHTAALQAKDSDLSSLRNELLVARDSLEKCEIGRDVAEKEAQQLESTKAKLVETESLLIDRSRRLEELLVQRKSLDSTIHEMRANDRTNVLEGRVQALEDVIAEREATIKAQSEEVARAASRADNLQVDITGQEKKNAELETHIGILTAQLGEKDLQLDRYRSLRDDTETRLQETETHSRSLLDASVAEQEALSKLIDDLREEIRAQQRIQLQQEVTIAERDSEARAARGDAEALETRVKQQERSYEMLEERFKKSQTATETSEAQAAKDRVLLFEARGELVTARTTIDALKQELESVTGERNEKERKVVELEGEVSRNDGILDQLRVTQHLRERLEGDNDDAKMTIETLRARLAEESTKAERVLPLEQDVAALKDQLSTKVEAVDMLIVEKQGTVKQIEKLKDDLGVERSKAKVVRAQLSAEEDRRREVERRVQTLESAMSEAHTTHGKYVALQRFVQSSTSDAAKALELNNSLLEEVRNLEARLVTSEKNCADLREAQRLGSIAEAESASTRAQLVAVNEQLTAQTDEVVNLQEALKKVGRRAESATELEERESEHVARLAKRTEELLVSKQQLQASRESTTALQLKLEAAERSYDDAQTRLSREVTGRARDRDEHQAALVREQARYNELLGQLSHNHAQLVATERGEAAVNTALRDLQDNVAQLQERNRALTGQLEDAMSTKERLVIELATAERQQLANNNSNPAPASPLRDSESRSVLVALKEENLALRDEVSTLRSALRDLQRQLEQSAQGPAWSPSRTRRPDPDTIGLALPAEVSALRVTVVDKMEEIAVLEHELKHERQTTDRLREQLAAAIRMQEEGGDAQKAQAATAHAVAAAEANAAAWKAECSRLERELMEHSRRALEREGRITKLEGELAASLTEVQVMHERQQALRESTIAVSTSRHVDSEQLEAPAPAPSNASQARSAASRTISPPPRNDLGASRASRQRAPQASNARISSTTPEPSKDKPRRVGSVTPPTSPRPRDGSPKTGSNTARNRAADAKAKAILQNAQAEQATRQVLVRENRQMAGDLADAKAQLEALRDMQLLSPPAKGTPSRMPQGRPVSSPPRPSF